MKNRKIQIFETLVSSGRAHYLSNFGPGFLNYCQNIVRSVLPQACWLCGAPGASSPICAGCDADLPHLPRSRCAVCALPIATGTICGGCLQSPPRFDRVVTVFGYRYPVDALICAFKYGGRLALARPLGEALAQIGAPDVDAIVAMPLARKRLAERGFNQAQELARVAAARTGIPLLPFACRRIIETPPQAALPWQERARNVRRAFVCDADFTGMRIAVVDDVLTTGATLNELARVLRKAGAREVSGWVVARTLPR
jgi:ComF family protein